MPPAIRRINQAVAEIKKVAKKGPALAAEGAIALLERATRAATISMVATGALDRLE